MSRTDQQAAKELLPVDNVLVPLCTLQVPEEQEREGRQRRAVDAQV